MLEVQGLHAGYGSVPIVRDVTFQVDPGEILLILGSNGAGKTTLLKSLVGFVAPTAGQVLLDGADVTGSGPATNSRRGLRLVLEEHRVFPDLTVEENLRLGQAALVQRTPFHQRADEVLELFPVLGEKIRLRARSLSGGQQQMLALAQALMGKPQVLLCDEPSRGLAQALLPDLLDFLRLQAEQGTAVVIVEQMLDVAMPIADRAIVLEDGAIAMHGPAADIAANDQVRRIYLGLD